MNFLRNAKVRNKLMFMSSSFIVFLILIGAIGFYYIQTSNSKINDMYKSNLLAIQYLGSSKATYDSTNADLFELMVTKDNNRDNELVQSIKNKKLTIKKSIVQYESIPLDSSEVISLKLLKDNMVAADKVEGNIITLAEANKNDEAYAEYNKNLNPVNQKIEKNVSDLIEYNVKTASKTNQENLVSSTSARSIILVIIILAIVLGIFISVFIIRLITIPIISMESYIEKVASGDLREETLLKTKSNKLYNDETAKSISNIAYGAENQLNNVMDTSKEITDEIQEASNASQNISSGSQKVVTSMEKVDNISKEVSNHSQTIAASIEEQTAAMHEIAGASEELAKIGENLMVEVAKFKL